MGRFQPLAKEESPFQHGLGVSKMGIPPPLLFLIAPAASQSSVSALSACSNAFGRSTQLHLFPAQMMLQTS